MECNLSAWSHGFEVKLEFWVEAVIPRFEPRLHESKEGLEEGEVFEVILKEFRYI